MASEIFELFNNTDQRGAGAEPLSRGVDAAIFITGKSRQVGNLGNSRDRKTGQAAIAVDGETRRTRVNVVGADM